MKTYNVALKEGVDYNAFWNEIETNGSSSTYVPNRSVSIVNERSSSLRQCWYELSDVEAEKLRNDARVYCVEIPPEFRTDIEIKHTGTQTGLYYKGPNTGNNPDNNLGINWGLFRSSSRTNNTPDNSGTLTYEYSLDGAGVDVVIQDTGCETHHPEFNDANGNSRVQLINWYTENGFPPYPYGPQFPSSFYSDHDGHGTHVAGIAAGKTYGRAKNAKIYIMTLEGLAVDPTYGISVSISFDLGRSK
jgi:subtilisin family serine protease